MYGTIFNLKVKPGHLEALLEIIGNNDTPAGGVAWFLLKPDDEQADLIGVAVFESKEAHLANANRPGQHEMFVKMMDHLLEKPSWTDGTYVLGEISR